MVERLQIHALGSLHIQIRGRSVTAASTSVRDRMETRMLMSSTAQIDFSIPSLVDLKKESSMAKPLVDLLSIRSFRRYLRRR
jgi:hypothetical protein